MDLELESIGALKQWKVKYDTRVFTLHATLNSSLSRLYFAVYLLFIYKLQASD